jgi:AAA domain
MVYSRTAGEGGARHAANSRTRKNARPWPPDSRRRKSHAPRGPTRTWSTASPRRAELIVGPAGTGKTYTAVRIAEAWRAAGKGQVVGIAATSAGRNVLIEAGIPVAENTAQFLGHLPGQREARGATSLGPDALVILDEASTTSMPDLAAILRHATRSGAKLIITGDHAQLGAVQSGGGMAMLARKLGYAQLTEAVLAPVVRRDDAELSATETRDQALSDADHLGVLHAIWMDQCRAEAYGRYAQAVHDHAEPADAAEILKDTDHLWRTIHAAELAGFDGAHLIRAAIIGRPFTGARSHSAVLDARIRTMTGEPPPKTWDSWTARLPRFADPELGQYMAEVAAAMDDRQRRIGQHAAQERPLWAAQALGQVPADRHQRAGWEARAEQLGAYREMFGWDHPGEAIGPEPAATFPEARAEWHAAFAVMARVEGIDVRGLSNGQLFARRRAYEAETSWAPKHVAEELRAARKQEQFSKVEATRHAYDAAAAARHGNAALAALHERAAGSWATVGQRATLIGDTLAEAPRHPRPMGGHDRTHPPNRPGGRHRAQTPRHAQPRRPLAIR